MSYRALSRDLLGPYNPLRYGEFPVSRDMNEVIIVDLESTCWEGKPPAGMRSEIIEIGAIRLSLQDLAITNKTSILVKPVCSTVSEFCTRLTTLTQAILDEYGVSFREAVVRLKSEFKPKDKTWASYGDYDRRMFEEECRFHGVQYPFGRTHINIKNLHAVLSGLYREVGMAEALPHYGLNLIGTHHRGSDDAFNIASIFQCILSRFRGVNQRIREI